MIEVTHDGSVRVLRLAHRKASALDRELCEALERSVADFAASGDRALVVTGSGSIFCAGVDLLRVIHGGRAYLEGFLPALERAFLSLFALERPVVTAINGHAIAGGFVIAQAGDRRLCARGDATLGAPELGVGVPFPAIAVEILRGALPTERLHTVLYTGRIVGPEVALAEGLVDELADSGALLDRALAVAGELAAVPARSFALTKRLVRAPALEFLARAGPAAARDVLEGWSSPEVLAAIHAYAERVLGKS